MASLDEHGRAWVQCVAKAITAHDVEHRPVYGDLIVRLAAIARRVPLDVAEKVIQGNGPQQWPPAVVRSLEDFVATGELPAARRRRFWVTNADGEGRFVDYDDAEISAALAELEREGCDVTEV